MTFHFSSNRNYITREMISIIILAVRLTFFKDNGGIWSSVLRICGLSKTRAPKLKEDSFRDCDKAVSFSYCVSKKYRPTR